MDMKVIELLEDLVSALSFDYISKNEKATLRNKIRKILDELA
jgi:hypothetical protein